MERHGAYMRLGPVVLGERRRACEEDVGSVAEGGKWFGVFREVKGDVMDRGEVHDVHWVLCVSLAFLI